MANKEAIKVPFIRERLKQAVKHKGTNIKNLGEVPDIDRSEKTIQRSLRDQKISPATLDKIARYLNVDPAFLSGKYDLPLQEISDPALKDFLEAYYLQPQNFPYKYKEQREVNYAEHLKTTLLLHGVSKDDYLQLSREEKSSLERRLDTAVTRVLREYFPNCSRAENARSDLRSDELTLEDIIEMYLEELISAGVFVGRWGDEE